MTPEESAAHAIAQATAQPTKLFENDALYTITTTVDGVEYALTFVLPQNATPGAVTSSPSNASVKLLPLTEGDATQMWRPKDAGVNPAGYLLQSRITDDNSRLTGIMEIQNINSAFGDPDNDPFHDKYNRVTVGYHSNEISEYWVLEKLSNDTFRVMSYIGLTENLNTAGGDSTYKWNESRSLEAFKGADGTVKLRHMPTLDKPTQQWKFTKVGFFTNS